MRKILALGIVLVLFLVGVAGPAGADSDTRPFKATVAGQLTWTPVPPACAPTFVSTASAAAGTATHLGRVTMVSEHCTPPGLDYGPGDMVFTAANGDELHLDYWGTCPPYLELPIGEVLTCTVEFSVVGGTGRFLDAGGSGTGYASLVWGGLTAPTADAWWSFEGALSY